MARNLDTWWCHDLLTLCPFSCKQNDVDSSNSKNLSKSDHLGGFERGYQLVLPLHNILSNVFVPCMFSQSSKHCPEPLRRMIIQLRELSMLLSVI